MKSSINLYSIKDTVAGVCMSPYTSVNNETAKRNFAKVCASVDYSDDFQLFKVGTYDTDTGKVEGCEPEFICNGGDIVE